MIKSVSIPGALKLGGALLAVSLMSGNAIGKTYNLRFSDIGPPRGPRPATMMWWAEEIEKRTKGQVKIKFYWSQSLVKGKETLKAVGSGLVDVGTVMGLYTPADVPMWNLANAPFGGRDPWVGMRTWQDLRAQSPALRKETQKKNVKILVNFTTGAVDILSKEPIKTAADIDGKKFRSTGGWTGLLRNLGATPVRIGFGELYQALDKGTVDATINYIAAVKAYKHYEIAQHVTEVQMGQVLGYGIGINMKRFNKMPKDIQKIILEVSDEFPAQYGQRYFEGVAAAKKEMMAGIDGKKVTFHTMSEEERAKMKAQGEFYVKEWIAKMTKKGIDAQGFYDKMNVIRTKYQKELADKGHPWTRKK